MENYELKNSSRYFSFFPRIRILYYIYKTSRPATISTSRRVTLTLLRFLSSVPFENTTERERERRESNKTIFASLENISNGSIRDTYVFHKGRRGRVFLTRVKNWGEGEEGYSLRTARRFRNFFSLHRK